MVSDPKDFPDSWRFRTRDNHTELWKSINVFADAQSREMCLKIKSSRTVEYSPIENILWVPAVHNIFERT